MLSHAKDERSDSERMEREQDVFNLFVNSCLY